MSLVARALEEAGIPTIVVGSAKDIVEYCGVPRYLFTDFPLGNPCGKPYDRESQRTVMDSALGVLATASQPGTTVETDLVWDDSGAWKDAYMRVSDENRESLRAAGEARRAERASWHR
ncbi:MAG: hypothetical protein AAF384_19855 [Pseudomonadota bacterium]